MGQFGIGQPLRRKEDPRLLQGRGAYTDDMNVEGQFWAAFLRSPHPHADILSIDIEAAKAAPGVKAVFTSADLDADGVPDMPCEVELSDLSGAPMWKPMRPILARGRVRFVGECVAIVIASTQAEAREAAELIEIDWSERPGVADAREAIGPDAPLVWPELGGNVPVHWQNKPPPRPTPRWRARPGASASASSTTGLFRPPWSPRARSPHGTKRKASSPLGADAGRAAHPGQYREALSADPAGQGARHLAGRGRRLRDAGPDLS